MYYYDKKNEYHDSDEMYNIQDIDCLKETDSVSACECTGLITNGKGDEDELGYYAEVYKFGTFPDELGY